MPFTKITTGKNKGKYRGPSGRVFTLAQVQKYYATGGTWKSSTKKRSRK